MVFLGPLVPFHIGFRPSHLSLPMKQTKIINGLPAVCSRCSTLGRVGELTDGQLLEHYLVEAPQPS